MFTQGVNGKVVKDDCKASNNRQNHVNSLLRWAQLAGKSTGVVTNTRITHATPAVAYAHSASRLYESDYDVDKLGGDKNACVDIARQLIEGETGKNLFVCLFYLILKRRTENTFFLNFQFPHFRNVIMGGGSVKFLPNTAIDSHGNRGERLDGRNLIDEWISNKSDESAYVTNRKSLLDINYAKTKNVMGLFASAHMAYHSDTNHSVEPTLTEMTQAAMNVLSLNPNGYVLLVEGGLIDYANHETMAQKAVIETLEFNEAIKMADLRTSEIDTMIVVTSDHSHTISMSGI